MLSTTPGAIATPFANEAFDPAVYVRLRNGENPAGASMGMNQLPGGPLCTGAFTQVRGLDFLGAGVNVMRQGDLLEGCIAQGVCGQNDWWSEPNYAVGPTVKPVREASATGRTRTR